MSILDNLLGLSNKVMEKFSNSERTRRRRNAIQKLREKRMQIVYSDIPNDKRVRILADIDKRMSKLRKDAEAE